MLARASVLVYEACQYACPTSDVKESVQADRRCHVLELEHLPELVAKQQALFGCWCHPKSKE